MKQRGIVLLIMALAAASLSTLSTASSAAAEGPTVTVTGSVNKIRPEDASLPAGTTQNISAARNEFASAQVVVHAQGGPLPGISVVQSTPFTKQGGATLPSSSVTIYREDYYTVTRPSDGEAGQNNPCTVNCRWPDALIPTVDPIHNESRNAWPVDIPTGENRVAWIDVLVPAGQAAGTYTSTFEARQGANAIGAVTVTLTVVDWTMPTTSTLQGTFALDWHNVCRTWGGNGNDCSSVPGGIWTMYGQIVRLMLDNRVSVSGPAAGAPTPANMALFDQHALPYIKGTGPTRLPGAKLSTVLLNRWEDWAMAHWRAKAVAEGFEDRVTFYCDEVAQNPATWNNICNTPFALAQSNWNAGNALPDTALPSAIIGTWQDMQFARAQDFPISDAPLQTVIPLVTRVHTGPSSDSGKPNWWGPYPGQTFFGNQRSIYDSFLAERPGHNRLWLYTSCMTEGCGDAWDGHPRYGGWPSYAIDQSPGEARAMAWQVFNHRATGEYYYEISKRMDSAFTDQYEDGGQGDGTLIYPGKASRIGGNTDTVLESIRLKQIREGREDYEFLAHLANTGREAQARSIAGDYTGVEGPYGSAGGLMGAMYDSSRSQSAYDAARALLEGYAAGDDPQVGPTCNGRAATIVGASPTILGTPGDDVIVGTAGEDNIYSGAGNDTICGGVGYDTIRPGAGTDWVDGGADGNAIDYSDADHGVDVDLVAGTADTDQIRNVNEVFGSVHNDHLRGDGAANFLAGNFGNDVLEGRGGSDLIWGRSSDVPPGGQSDDDTIDPGAGTDRVFAYEGADEIAAVDGFRDEISCGSGTDTGQFDAIDQTAADCEAPSPPGDGGVVVPDAPRDLCLNIDGVQAVAPDGKRVDASGACVATARTTARLKQANARWKALSCGATLKAACVMRRSVRLAGSVSPQAGLTGRQVQIEVQRRADGRWTRKSTLRVTLNADQGLRKTLSLDDGRWRMRLKLANPRAVSAWQYLRAGAQ